MCTPVLLLECHCVDTSIKMMGYYRAHLEWTGSEPLGDGVELEVVCLVWSTPSSQEEGLMTTAASTWVARLGARKLRLGYTSLDAFIWALLGGDIGLRI